MQDKGFWQVLSVLTDQAPEDNEPHRFRPAEGMPNTPESGEAQLEKLQDCPDS